MGVKVVQKVRAKGVTGLAWVSLVLAVAGGALAADMFIGDTLGWILDHQPIEYLPELLLVVGVVAIGLDLFMDGVPNQVAIYGALLVPSVATSTFGKLGQQVEAGSGWILDFVDENAAEWAGTNSSTGLALVFVISALLVARRVVKKGGNA